MPFSQSSKGLIRFSKNLIHLFLGITANIFYGFPSNDMIVIGVTGTDGKTTTSTLLYHILKESGKKAALISTVGAFINDRKYDVGFHVTTPSPFLIQKYIKKAKTSGTKYLILEVTSHALDQNRVAGIHFDAAILTNITHEHLDYHGSYDRYVNAKLKLLKRSTFNVVNFDDKSFEFVKRKIDSNTLFTYSLKSKDADINIAKYAVKTKLFGEFNALNSLAAVAIAKKLQLPDDKINSALLSFSAPDGRQEIIKDDEFYVILDFAHTPYSFEKMLPEAKKLVENNGKLIHVFGAAGKRDFLKRPKMGDISSRFSDVIILTAEDPRSEKVTDINAQIRKGIDKSFNLGKADEYGGEKKTVLEIEDRKKALEFAIKIAKKGDVVIATGKGHEQSMNLGNGEISWSEREILQNAL